MAAVQAAGEVVGMAGCITLAAAESGQIVDVERVAWGSELPWPGAGEGVEVDMAWSTERCFKYNRTEQDLVEILEGPLLGEAPWQLPSHWLTQAQVC